MLGHAGGEGVMGIKCTSIMGRIFGHKWFAYGGNDKVTLTMACVYLHVYHYDREKIKVPKKGFICQRCGAVVEDVI